MWLQTLFADHVYFYLKAICLYHLHIVLIWKQNLYQVEDHLYKGEIIMAPKLNTGGCHILFFSNLKRICPAYCAVFQLFVFCFFK